MYISENTKLLKRLFSNYLMGAKPPYKLIVNEEYYGKDNFLKESREQELKNYQFVVESLGKSRGWGGNPRWDLIIEKGLEYYLKGGQ